MHRLASTGMTKSSLSIISLASAPALALIPLSHPDRGFSWEVFIALLALLLAMYLGAFVHESGHALFGWWMGYRVTSFGMGVGRPLVVWRCGTTRVYFALSRPMQGITFVVHPRLLPPVGASLTYLAGGPILQSVFAVLLVGAAWLIPRGREALLLAGVVNGVWAFVNFIPMRVRIGTFTMRSDGRLMLDFLRRGSIETPIRDLVHTIEGLRGLWTRVGDTLILRCTLLGQAIKWVELGACEPARHSWEESESLPSEPWSWLQAYRLLVQAEVASASGSQQVAQQAITRAEELFAAEDHIEGLFLIAMARVNIHLREGDIQAARTRLAELAKHPLAIRRPALGAWVGIHLLRLAANLPAPDLAAMEGEASQILRRHPSLGLERRFYHTLAHAAAAGGDVTRAQRAYQAALTAAEQLYAGWTHEPSRLAFIASQAALIADARTYFETQGLSGEAEKLKEMFPTPKEAQRRQREAAERRTRRQHRLLRWAALASMVPALLALFAIVRNPMLEKYVLFPASMVAACSVLSLFTSFAMQLLGCLFSELRRTFGWYPWLFLVGGWLVAAVGCFLPQ
jgi:hypothetical protein